LTDGDEDIKNVEGKKISDFSNVNTTCAKHLTDFPPTSFFLSLIPFLSDLAVIWC